jgi:hypothetical protein
MAREYPRFLFSNPQNTKSKGPFIVHTINPVCIMKVEFTSKKTFRIEFLEMISFENHFKPPLIPANPVQEVMKDCYNWLQAQIKSGNISI